jgi:hypothetical protein
MTLKGERPCELAHQDSMDSYLRLPETNIYVRAKGENITIPVANGSMPVRASR